MASGLPNYREEHDPASEGPLGTAFARGVRNNVIAEIAAQGIRVAAMVVFARVLMPADLGLFYILLALSVLVALVADSGIPDAMIQRKELRPEHHATAWWISFALSAAVAVLLYSGAPIAARIMAMPRLVIGLRLLCIPLVLEGTASVAGARLRRAVRFGKVAAADVAGEAAFLLVGLAVLWAGSPVWSLPAGLCARFAAHALLILCFDPQPSFAMPRVRAARDLGGFAGVAAGGRIVYLLSFYADSLLVGRLLGAAELGFYGNALALLQFVPDRLHSVAGRVLMPAFCQFQDDDKRLADAYRDFFGYVARIVMPLIVCVSIAAPEVITTLYGSKWLPAAQILRVLSIGLVLTGLRVGISAVYFSKNHPAYDLYLHGGRLIAVVIVCFAFVNSGVLGISAAISGVEAVMSVIAIWISCRLISLNLWDLVRSTLPALRLTALCALATMAGRLATRSAGLEGPLALGLIVLGPAVVYSWFEAPTVLQMFAAAFGRETTSSTAIPLTVERRQAT